MRRFAKLCLIFVMCMLTLALVCKVRAQAEGENVKTFFDSEIPGIKIQANATGETQPTENLTIWMALIPENNVYVNVKLFQFDLYGFLNGTVKVLIGNITRYNFPLNGTSGEYKGTFPVPDNVWGVTFGEIKLDYEANLPMGIILANNATNGFYMTNVENTFLENLESSYNQLNETFYNLTATYTQLNQSYTQLNQNYTLLNQTYTTLQGNMNELDNTRRVAVILAITTVFFVVTTVFVVMRRPRESW